MDSWSTFSACTGLQVTVKMAFYTVLMLFHNNSPPTKFARWLVWQSQPTAGSQLVLLERIPLQNT